MLRAQQGEPDLARLATGGERDQKRDQPVKTGSQSVLSARAPTSARHRRSHSGGHNLQGHSITTGDLRVFWLRVAELRKHFQQSHACPVTHQNPHRPLKHFHVRETGVCFSGHRSLQASSTKGLRGSLGLQLSMVPRSF